MAFVLVAIVLRCLVIVAAAVVLHFILNNTHHQNALSNIIGSLLQQQQSPSESQSPPSLEFLMVADLDRGSKHTTKPIWNSVLKRAKLVRERNGNFTLSFLGDEEVSTEMARKNRAMELSLLVSFGGTLFSACDSTGVLFRIFPTSRERERAVAVPDRVLVDGPAATRQTRELSTKGMKAEWATVKDGSLLVGSIGKEWIDGSGHVKHRDPEWVKRLDARGGMVSENWGPAFTALRKAVGTSFPAGYMWHEAIHWFEEERKWVVLPRKASTDTPYSPKADENMGTNLLLLASEDFSEIDVRRLGPLEPAYGFTAVRKLPGKFNSGGGNELRHLFVGLKVREEEETDEKGMVTHTKLAVFDLEGRFYTDPPFLHVSDDKYEGLEFWDRE